MKYLILFALLACSACQKATDEFDPAIVYFPNPLMLAARPSAFAPLTPQECRFDWGKELRVGYRFAKEQDFYRAITAFKRALIFLPPAERERKKQIEYAIMHAYYLAYKYQEVVETYESSSLLCNLTAEFPACRDLLLQLYEAYSRTGASEKASQTLVHILTLFPEEGEKLKLSEAILQADFPAVIAAAEIQPVRAEIDGFIADYARCAKSVERARTYQAILPGAGYYYVGQRQAAFTSFVINTLFVWAAYRFFEQGNIAAGLVTASLETGWYFGGINGAGLAAKEYNERLYHTAGRDFMRSPHSVPHFNDPNELLMSFRTFCLICICLPLAADPWGKDADLCRPRACLTASQGCKTPFFGPVAEALIQFHQDIISPCDGPRSHFLPSSSQYTLEAIRKYGFYQGFTMGCDRLMRENSDPWVYRTAKDPSGKKVKLDPVP